VCKLLYCEEELQRFSPNFSKKNHKNNNFHPRSAKNYIPNLRYWKGIGRKFV
jgi:hypothetical protein